MREFSPLYKELRSREDSKYEVKIVRGDTTYAMDRLQSVSIHQALFDGGGPKIGGVYSSRCIAKIREESTNWPRAASFEVFIRLLSADGTQESEWESMSTYYTDERHTDKYGNITITAYDGMALLEQPWTDKILNTPDTWPVTAKRACDMLTEALGVSFDRRTVLDNTVPFIGLDTTSTARDTLAAVAGGLGGNWYLTAEGKLRLVILRNILDLTPAVAGIAVVGKTVVGDDTSGIINENIGMSVESIDIGTSTGGTTNVELQTSSGITARVDRGNGYTIKGTCDFSNSQIAEVCANNVYGFAYKPFSAKKARLDPIAELGDVVEIDGDTYQMYTINWNINQHITADISAPYEESVDHEYPVLSESAKNYRKAIGYIDGTNQQTGSFIQQTADAIRTSVSQTYVQRNDLNQRLTELNQDIADTYYTYEEGTDLRSRVSTLEQTSSGFQLNITRFENNINGRVQTIESYVRYDGELDPPAIVIGKKGDPASFRLSNKQISLYYENTVVSYWNQQKQVTPSELEIPFNNSARGKFTLGSILFQPRSTGNMSILWVGQNDSSAPSGQ